MKYPVRILLGIALLSAVTTSQLDRRRPPAVLTGHNGAARQVRESPTKRIYPPSGAPTKNIKWKTAIAGRGHLFADSLGQQNIPHHSHPKDPWSRERKPSRTSMMAKCICIRTVSARITNTNSR